MTTKADDKEVLNKISNIRLFQGLSKSSLDFLSQHGAIRVCKKEDQLWGEGDPALFFAVILRGNVNIIRSTQEGLEKITGIFGPGDMIGISAFIRRAAFPAVARVVATDSQIVKFYLKLESLDHNDPLFVELNYWLREMLLLHEKILFEKIDVMSSKNLDAKLFKLLSHLLARFGIKSGGSKEFIPMYLSKTQLAGYVEARVESTIRTLNEWEKNGWIKMTQEGVHIPNIKDIESHIRSKAN